MANVCYIRQTFGIFGCIFVRIIGFSNFGSIWLHAHHAHNPSQNAHVKKNLNGLNLSNHVHFAANIPSIVCCSIELNEHNVIISLQTKIRSLMGLSCLETTKSFIAELKEINLGYCAGGLLALQEKAFSF